MLNSEESGDDRYKLILTEQDRDTYIALLNKSESVLINPSEKILENFNIFQNYIEDGGLSPEKIYEGVNRLMLISVMLDKNYDNPQLIFESMNSTGKDLSQADLIRNYILMGLEPEQQSAFYKTYWRTMEQMFGQKGYAERFDRFIRDFLTSQNPSGKICKLSETYEAFKLYYSKYENSEHILKTVFTFARYYTNIDLEKEPDKDLEELWKEIRDLEMRVSYPFLMNVYHDYSMDLINKEGFITIIRATISYIVRRVVCEIPTNSLNKTFATFYKKIDKNNYLKSILAEYILKDSYRAFPADEELREKLWSKDIYHLKIKNYILEKLENQDHKETITILGQGLTVEHIMPQNHNLSEEWKQMLGDKWEEVQRNYLHTIGNLTLTAYNSEMSDSPFEVKKSIKGGFKDSHLRLNNYVAEQACWNETTIRQRISLLADQIVKIWKYPVISDEDLQKYGCKSVQKNFYQNMNHYPQMNADINEIYNKLDRIILSLDSGIAKEYKKQYIAYKVDSNFVDIEPFKGHIRIWLNMEYEELDDPRGIGEDVRNRGHHGNGEIEIKVTAECDIDYLMYLIRQSLTYQLDETD